MYFFLNETAMKHIWTRIKQSKLKILTSSHWTPWPAAFSSLFCTRRRNPCRRRSRCVVWKKNYFEIKKTLFQVVFQCSLKHNIFLRNLIDVRHQFGSANCQWFCVCHYVSPLFASLLLAGQTKSKSDGDRACTHSRRIIGAFKNSFKKIKNTCTCTARSARGPPRSANRSRL